MSQSPDNPDGVVGGGDGGGVGGDPDDQPASSDAAEDPAGRLSAWGRRTLLAAGAGAATAGLVVLLYYVTIHTYATNSDKATTILEGQSIAHGNLLLHGWVLSTDSHWTNDALVAAVGVLVVGLKPQLMFMESVIMAVLFIWAAVLYCWEAARTRAAGIAGMSAVLLLVALPSPTLQYFVLDGAWHIGTAIWALAAFACVRSGRYGAGWAGCVLCLAVGTLGDLDLVAYAIVPIALVGALITLRQRSVRAGLPFISAAFAGGALFELVHLTAGLLGAFTDASHRLPFAPASQYLPNIGRAFDYAAQMIGAMPGYNLTRVPQGFAYVHILGALVIVAGVVLAGAHLGQQVLGGLKAHGAALGHGAQTTAPAADPSRLLDDLLLLGLVGSVATFLLQTRQGGPHFARYLTVGVLFACVLAGRFVSRTWPPVRSGRARRAIAAAAIASAVGCAAVLGVQMSEPSRWQGMRNIVRFLEQHHLYRGIGDYWSSNVISVASEGQVTVRPVRATSTQGVIATMGQSIKSWYNSDQTFQFLIFDKTHFQHVNMASAVRTFGEPAHVYTLRGYQVLVWSHEISIPKLPATTYDNGATSDGGTAG